MSDRTDERVDTIEHVLPGCGCGLCEAAREALASLAADAAETQTLREETDQLRAENGRLKDDLEQYELAVEEARSERVVAMEVAAKIACGSFLCDCRKWTAPQREGGSDDR